MGRSRLGISERSQRISQSEIRTMSLECERVGGINLSQGICDLELPSPVRAGAHRAIDAGLNHYTRYDGIPELREAIARKARAFNGIEADPGKNITVSCGATGAFYCACLALLNPGDEVILFEPCYGYHVTTLLAANAVPRYVKLSPPGWGFDPAELERQVTPRTRGVMINSPANPSGKVFSREEILLIAEICDRHDLHIFTDEIYEYFVYDGRAHCSPASIPEIRDRVVTISGHSKTFSITGWRIGYCIAREEFARAIGYVNDLVYVCGPAPLQAGVAAGIFELPDEFYRGLCATYLRKRDSFCAVLSRAGLTPSVPQGAYYVLADISRLPGETSKQKALYLMEKTGVASVPGEAFYPAGGGGNLARFCFAKDDSVLETAGLRLLEFLT